MEITPGSDADLDDFVEVLEEAGAWLSSRGIPQWPAGSNRELAAWLGSQLGSGGLLCLRDTAGTLFGGCVLGTEPYEAWRGYVGEAAYLHKLVVSRSVGGHGWGARLVEHAEQWTLERGRALLRLDCWEGNEALRAYYRELGFAELDSASEGSYLVRLFEKKLGNRGSS